MTFTNEKRNLVLSFCTDLWSLKRHFICVTSTHCRGPLPQCTSHLGCDSFAWCWGGVLFGHHCDVITEKESVMECGWVVVGELLGPTGLGWLSCWDFYEFYVYFIFVTLSILYLSILLILLFIWLTATAGTKTFLSNYVKEISLKSVELPENSCFNI